MRATEKNGETIVTIVTKSSLVALFASFVFTTASGVAAQTQTADDSSFADFRRFGALLSADVIKDRLHEAKVPGDRRLLLGWATCPLC